MTNVYDIKSIDATDLEKFYLQTAEQVWYVLNAKRINGTPKEERDGLWEAENKRPRDCERKFDISFEEGFTDLDVGYLLGLYATTKFYAENIISWTEIDKEIDGLVKKYELINHTN